MAKARIPQRPDRIHRVDQTLEQLQEQTRELYKSITAKARAARPAAKRRKVSPSSPLVDGQIGCPSCHVLNSVHTSVRYGRTSYYCPNCGHGWSALATA